jgi:hypothetical protein
MLIQKCPAVDDRGSDVLRRAFDGACWSVGIPRHPCEGETKDIAETRDAIALTVLRCASAAAHNAQALKVSVLRCLYGNATLAPRLVIQVGCRRRVASL